MNCEDKNNPQCWSDEKRRRHQFMTLKRFLRRELRRFCLTHRQQTIAEVIVELSLGWGNRSVIIPKLDIFTELTGITKNNVHAALKALHEMHVITAKIDRGLASYEVNLDPETWQVTRRINRDRIKNAINMLKPFNGIKEDEDQEITTARQQVQGSISAADKSNGNNQEHCEFPADVAEEISENFKDYTDTHILWQDVLSLRTIPSRFPSEIS